MSVNRAGVAPHGVLLCVAEVSRLGADISSLCPAIEVELKAKISELLYVKKTRLNEEIGQFRDPKWRQKCSLSCPCRPDDQKMPFDHADNWRRQTR
jgi:hypothetical protein